MLVYSVFRSKGIFFVWINSFYILASASLKIKFTNPLVVEVVYFFFWNRENSKAEIRTGADEINLADFHFVYMTCLHLQQG